VIDAAGSIARIAARNAEIARRASAKAARNRAHHDCARERAQFYVIHKRARPRERITPAEFHFVDFWG